MDQSCRADRTGGRQQKIASIPYSWRYAWHCVNSAPSRFHTARWSLPGYHFHRSSSRNGTGLRFGYEQTVSQSLFCPAYSETAARLYAAGSPSVRRFRKRKGPDDRDLPRCRPPSPPRGSPPRGGSSQTGVVRPRCVSSVKLRRRGEAMRSASLPPVTWPRCGSLEPTAARYQKRVLTAVPNPAMNSPHSRGDVAIAAIPPSTRVSQFGNVGITIISISSRKLTAGFQPSASRAFEPSRTSHRLLPAGSIGDRL